MSEMSGMSESGVRSRYCSARDRTFGIQRLMRVDAAPLSAPDTHRTLEPMGVSAENCHLPRRNVPECPALSGKMSDRQPVARPGRTRTHPLGVSECPVADAPFAQSRYLPLGVI